MNNDLKFLKHAIRSKSGKKTKVRYSQGIYTKESGLPKGTITIYAKDYGGILPKELKPINETDIMTDLFCKDIARVKPKSKYYKQVLKLLKQ